MKLALRRRRLSDDNRAPRGRSRRRQHVAGRHARRVMRLLALRRREPHEDLLQGGLRHGVIVDQAAGVVDDREGIFAVDLHDGPLRLLHRADVLDRREDLPELRVAGVVHPELELRVVALHDLRVDTLGDDGVVDDSREARLKPHVHRVPLGEPVLEVLQRAEALELAADHDADPVAQRLALLHAVRRQDDGAPLRARGDDVPHKATSLGVHPGRGLVQEHHRGLADERDGHRELALVSPGVSPRLSLRVLGQRHLLEQRVDGVVDQLVRDAPHLSVKLQVLPAGEVGLKAVELRAVSHDGSRAGQVLVHAEVLALAAAGDEHSGIAPGGREFPGDHLKRRRLTRAVDAEEAEALPAGHADG
mmetsp:Transcript_6995/g.28977  ORF Transcript_6995/g.28977 Transcript_6995/m.28977 type:complete len:362 (-) Transcript_6995:4912-5997(-)